MGIFFKYTQSHILSTQGDYTFPATQHSSPVSASFRPCHFGAAEPTVGGFAKLRLYSIYFGHKNRYLKSSVFPLRHTLPKMLILIFWLWVYTASMAWRGLCECLRAVQRAIINANRGFGFSDNDKDHRNMSPAEDPDSSTFLVLECLSTQTLRNVTALGLQGFRFRPKTLIPRERPKGWSMKTRK